jgi:histone H3/H4
MVFAYPPSTIGLRGVRLYQQSDDLLLPQREFQEFVREIGQDYCTDMQFTQNAYYMLQVAVEDKILRWARAALHLACEVKESQVLCKKDFCDSKIIANLI